LRPGSTCSGVSPAVRVETVADPGHVIEFFRVGSHNRLKAVPGIVILDGGVFGIIGRLAPALGEHPLTPMVSAATAATTDTLRHPAGLEVLEVRVDRMVAPTP
jgi:hypothetical protein